MDTLVPDLTQLEQAVLEKFLDGDHDVLSVLRRQLQGIRATKREFTGVGFYTNLATPADSFRVQGNRSFELSDVLANMPGLTVGAGFVLFVRDGLLATLEGYTFSNEPWPAAVTTFELSYRVGSRFEKRRDMEELYKRLK